jgi:hypothetical protein
LRQNAILTLDRAKKAGIQASAVADDHTPF